MVSVIVPVYKAELYLGKCLDSIINQTYRNLEIILVDDGSPDNSGAICDEYAKKDSRITVIHKENGGVSSARNAGLEAAGGAWIGFVDADDWCDANMYEYLVGLGQKYDADIVQCGLFLDEQESCELMFCDWEKDLIFGDVGQMQFCDIQRFGNSSCNKLFRADTLNQITYDPQCPMGEDLLFNLQVLQEAHGIVLGTQAKYHYLQHEDSACHVPPNYMSIHSHRYVLKQASALFEKGSATHDFFTTERLKMDMHNCFRMVVHPELKLEALREEIRADLRKEFCEILRSNGPTPKEKIKIFLIAWAWGVYRVLLLLSKKIKRESV